VSLLYYVYIYIYIIFYFYIYFILFLHDPAFLTTSIRAKGISQEKRVLGSSGRYGGSWKV
jgi:hypothetical protein